MRLPKQYSHEPVDLIIDCKKFHLPLNVAAKGQHDAQKVRGTIRKRSEGLKPAHTKPNDKRHRRNFGASAHVLAGICNGKLRLWEYYDGSWCGQKAADMYAGPMRKVLQRNRPKQGGKRVWRIVEDNDPSGFKSGKGERAKKSLGIVALEWPKYSPDLNPLDFSLWKQIEDRARQKVGNRSISAARYKVESYIM